MPLAIAIVIAAIGIGYAMSRVVKIRKDLPELAEGKPNRLSKREKRLEQIRAPEPEYVAPSIDDLVAAEIAEAGLDDIAGGQGVAPTVKLKVYRRDAPHIERCPPESRRYVLEADVDPSDAGVDDVRLICEGSPEPSAETPIPPQPEREPETPPD